jgi:quercetin dioxygenase-like cupin family protein
MLDVFEIDPSQTAPPPEPANFTGPVRMQNLHKPAGAQSVEALIVHFPAGARTRPHTHPGEQVLHFVRGSGFVHLVGEEEQRVPEGGIVIVPSGRLHMHGATEAEAICHIALRAPGPTDWNPAIPDEWREFTNG